jgi:putative membrane protein
MVKDMMNYGYSAGYGWLIALVIGLVVVAIAVYAVVQMGRDRNGRDGRYPPRHEKNDALDTLNRRYANGEISDEEYEQMKKRLENRN